MGAGNLASYLILFMMVVLVVLFKERMLLGSKEQEGTRVGAETHSEAEPIVTYANPIDKYCRENFPNAYK